MQTSNVLRNTISSILVEVVAVISGLILPKYFIGKYGSAVNGLVSSISQFVTYMGLVEAGVSAAAIVELYKPLATKDRRKINEIVSAAKGFYLKSGVVFIILDFILICGYPYLVNKEISDLSFVRIMIVVLSLNGIVDYFFLGKYRVLLTADQKAYIIAVAQAIGTLITLFFSVVLIKLDCSSLLVKSVVAIVYSLRTLYLAIYVRKHYDYISFDQNYSTTVFPQRRSALFHQVVGMICNNTDIVLLTIMLPQNALVYVSVYNAYNMVAANITSLFNSFSKGLGATYGELIAKDDNEALCNSFSYFELLYFILLFVVYICMGVLLFPFISLYSQKFSDNELYLRWDLVFLFTACGVIQNVRIPSMTVQIAAGHFKQTQVAALIEAVLNIGVSLFFVKKIGVSGVLIGTLASYVFRTSYVILYNSNHFIHGSLTRTVFRLIRNLVLMIVLVWAGLSFVFPLIHSWLSWIICSFVFFTIVSSLILFVNYVFEPVALKECWNSTKQLLRKGM